jgi:hypothetical protein
MTDKIKEYLRANDEFWFVKRETNRAMKDAKFRMDEVWKNLSTEEKLEVIKIKEEKPVGYRSDELL